MRSTFTRFLARFAARRECPVALLVAPRPPAPAELLAALVGRPAVNLDTPELQRFLAGKRVLVTGAGGSIGSEICRQAMRFCPDRVVLLDRAEPALFEIDRELRHRWVGADLRPTLADVCDRRRVDRVFADERPHVVFHCAAHKHVPLMEANPGEAVKNNVFGTVAVADAARNYAAQAFVLVSTDKAVNPTSVMGATKRVAELYVQSLSLKCHWSLVTCHPSEGTPSPGTSDPSQVTSDPSQVTRDAGAARPTRFVSVRFGNVLGSSGSVVPVFQKQIEAGGPVTVTHPAMERYFMTIPEASQLVMQAGAIGRGGEVFVLDMGRPVRILDLAREMIRRHGADVDIALSGVRPGEKLHEELAGADERTSPTGHEKIHVWRLPPADPGRVAEALDRLATASDGSAADAVAALAWAVPEYRPRGAVNRAVPSVLRLAGAAPGDAGHADAAVEAA